MIDVILRDVLQLGAPHQLLCIHGPDVDGHHCHRRDIADAGLLRLRNNRRHSVSRHRLPAFQELQVAVQVFDRRLPALDGVSNANIGGDVTCEGDADFSRRLHDHVV